MTEFNENMLECVNKFGDEIIAQGKLGIEGGIDDWCDMFRGFLQMYVVEKTAKQRCEETAWVSTTGYDENDKLTVMVNWNTGNATTAYSDFEIKAKEKDGYVKVATYSAGKLVEKYKGFKSLNIVEDVAA